MSEKLDVFFKEHPKIVLAGFGALIVVEALNLFEVCEEFVNVLRDARDGSLVEGTVRAASEALGG